jgi:DNA mismatch repair protein MutS
VEYIHNKGRVGVRSLFATHYHELTDLENSLKRLRNYHIAVKESGDDLVFLRKIVPGATDRSYGIHVARLAGVPHKVTQRAKEVLQNIENDGSIGGKTGKGKSGARYTQLLLFDPDGQEEASNDPVIEEIRGLDINAMTPIDALNKLNEIQKKMNGGD